MKQLADCFEGLLDPDFDVDLTLGDVVEWKPKFGIRLNSPTEYHGYSWNSKRFWAEHDTIQNAWNNDKHIATKNPIRLRHLKMDVRHGFSMALLCQPADFKLTQSNIDKFVKQFNKEWCQPDLQLEVHIKKEGDAYRFDMWNAWMKDDVNNYMCYFLIIPKTTTEGLLDTDFDIQDSDLAIYKVHTLNHKSWRIIPAMMDRIFQNAQKSFLDNTPESPEHVIDSGYGTRNMIRYFIDWIALQPIGDINDDQFTASKPRMVENFKKWINNPKFTLSLVKLGNDKSIYIYYNKRQLFCIKL